MVRVGRVALSNESIKNVDRMMQDLKMPMLCAAHYILYLRTCIGKKGRGGSDDALNRTSEPQLVVIGLRNCR